MKLDDRSESENVEDRRGMGTQAGLALGGGGGLIVLIIGLLLGVDPQQLRQLLNAGGQAAGVQQPRELDPAEEKQAHFTKVVFGDTERVWTKQFQAMGKRYVKPTLVLYSGSVESACGQADSAVGPFYCPGDSKVYIDLGFYADMQRKLHAPGDFARAYVVAHEVGHHVQKLLGYSEAADNARRSGNKVEANHMSVRLELQADYFAGVWAHHAQEQFNFLEPGDVDSALNAANQIGDDTLQRRARGTVVPDSFTHGTSKQRQTWFRRGLETGDVEGAKALFERSYGDL
jgi:predicted metalloprotease